MYLDDDRVVTSPSDLTTWAACEWSFLRRLDAKLGRVDAVADASDDMLDRTARLGDAHELRYLEALRATRDVVEFERPAPSGYAAAAEEARLAMASGADVLFQATFFDGSFIGFSDFVVRTDDGTYEVYDTKLARHAKIPALLQVAAYTDQICALGLPSADTVRLVLGDGSESVHDVADVLPVYRVQRDRLRAALAERLAADGPLAWGDPGVTACGRCAACQAQVDEHRDLVLVSGLRGEQRQRLHLAGVATIDELAGSDGPVAGIGATALARLRGQARVQLATERDHTGVPAVEVVDADALRTIPRPDAGDVFFDFEGDPLYTEGDGRAWGLDYLFGLVEADGTFRAFWAHDFAGERQALIDFLDYLAERRRRFPDLHVYHYASYERSHLLSLAARHGVGEDAVDDLLRDGLLVDLYPVVRQALLVGSHSYSLKKLEPLYMGDDLRQSDVKTATASITMYVDAIAERTTGDAARGDLMLDEVRDYNEYDCRSTLRLRDWLLELADRHGTRGDDPEGPTAPDPLELARVPREPNPVAVGLAAHVADVDPLDRTPDQTAIALAASAIDYHRREAKTFWQEHFDRLRNPVDDWADTRDVFVVETASVEREWQKLPRARKLSREVRLRGRLAPGSRLTEGGAPYAVYDAPVPPGVASLGPGLRGAVGSTVVEAGPNGDRHEVVLLERVTGDDDRHDVFPVALTPAAPPRATPQPEAIAEWGGHVLDALPEMLPDPAFDLLRRQPPRRRSGGGPAPVVGNDTVSAVVETLLDLDRSYLAVQGPPGTGKTYVGSRVIARLVREHGWRVGVVGQSHAVVENVLRAAITAGIDPERVGKVPKSGTTAEQADEQPWRTLKSGGEAAFLAEADGGAGGAGVDGGGQAVGAVFGATAWGFANADKVARASLDLLVVDEAGQFSLASTVAASVAATRLLLLGDPQQLPQVSQGSHPEPVDESALGWLADGHDVLPAEYGYFLATTWRMHPALCAPVSELSYGGALTAHASDRRLDGVRPGLHVEPVTHVGNTTSSVEEARAVVEIVRSVVGLDWSDADGTRPLTAADVIVVAPYNAHGAVLREHLDAAGFDETPVGTVDLFQGQEAVVAVVSLAASSAADIPRGLDFLLMPNRLNVALSRAKWAAFLVHSPLLATGLPTSIAGLGLLSGFLRLTGQGQPAVEG
ncbi:TM0106 family RecB-like putative nuclease [Frigoribacterium sp. CFBP 8751]|uniref:TM0106 family RecB-like putative nuclease n=1 Tax=Frigoribacterium sp. CFBP 8751 TaxID=2775277 RepID=UPI00178626F4|nr:TM0106 family RecB-like putative nuclease [Frigoribacterium sp. CFBP 8751]